MDSTGATAGPMSWAAGLVDGFAPLPDSPLVADLAVLDTDLPTTVGPDAARSPSGAIRVVVTGGAAQLSAPPAWCSRHGVLLGSLDTTLRDHSDLAGNARRVTVSAFDLPDELTLHVRVPVAPGAPTPSWLRAVDVLAEAEVVLALPAGAADLTAHVAAALDRECELSLVGGTVQDARRALVVVAREWDGTDDPAAARRRVRRWLPDPDVDLVDALAALSGEHDTPAR